MALKGDPDVFGPETQTEEEPTVYGFSQTVKRRTHLIVRVTWPIDAAGGDAAPETWELGGVTYQRLTTAVERGYGKANGTYTAVYRKEGTWATVIPT